MIFFKLSFHHHRHQAPLKLCDSYDYIVVGAGSSDCVVAARLSDDQDKTVLLIEAGPSDSANINIKIPAAGVDLHRSNVDWNFVVINVLFLLYI